MENQRVHAYLLVGLLSVAAATMLGRLVCPNLPTDFSEGVFDGVGVATLYGYLLARRTGRLWPSSWPLSLPWMVDVVRSAK
jgi:hypothetical protein